MTFSFLKDVTLGSCLRFFGITSLIVLLTIYIHFQARFFLEGPIVHLSDDYHPIQHTRVITLAGTTQNIVRITLNGKEIHTTATGEFTQPLVLENGYSIMEINAQDRFGRTTTVRREYVYVPDHG